MKHYDEGWNAYIDGQPYSVSASLQWRDGWRDCEEETIMTGQTQDKLEESNVTA